jgi:hypothetical protein
VPHVVGVASWLAVAQVAGDGAAEQERTLRNHADARPEVLPVHLAHVDAVDETAPSVAS